MEIKAKLSNLRIAPRKLRLVADLVRGKSAQEAQAILNFAVKKGTTPLAKLLKSAVANAKNNFQLEESNLYISKIMVDEGPKLKRWRARARGSANEIQKKTSHIILVLSAFAEGAGKIVEGSRKAEETGKGEKNEEKIFKTEKPRKEGEESFKGKARPKVEKETAAPKTGKALRKFFRRQVF